MSKLSHKNILFNQSGCLILEALEQYRDQGLSEADRIVVSEHLSQCPMCSEALEGLAMMTEKPGSAFYTNRINTRLRKSHAYTPLRARERNSAARFSRLLVPAAASIILLMSIIAYFQFFYPTQQELAILELPEVIKQNQEVAEMPDQQKTASQTEEEKETPAAIPETEQLDVPEDEDLPPPPKKVIQLNIVENDVEAEDDLMIAKEELIFDESAFGGVEEDVVLMDLDEEAIEVQAPSSPKRDKGHKLDDDARLGKAYEQTNSISLSNSQEQKEQADTNMIFTVIEAMPEFPGGMDSLYKYIQTNMVVPDDSGMHEAGKSYISFIVNRDGSISEVTLLRGFWDEFDQEAIRMVKAMPAWKPGQQRGQPVPVLMTLPIRYTPK